MIFVKRGMHDLKYQKFGGSGYIRGFEVERLYPSAKICQIYEGTNQIQHMIIARELLKKGAPS